MAAIAIRNLSKRLGDTVILHNIDLSIATGEMFFLLGPSGCGKTTLLRHIAGFYQPDTGDIRFNDKEVTHLPPHRRGTGMMFQSYALWPHLTVAENIAFGLEEQKRPRAEIQQRVNDALTLVKLAGAGERRIQQLSGGQQQRVALARALVIRPQCLLLDEPLSNLDAMLRLEMRNEIRGICKQFGITAVYVTHDQDEALSMADRIAVMDKGRIQQQNVPIEIYRHPANRMVAEFIGETNFLPGTILNVHGDPLPAHDSEKLKMRLVDVDTPVGILRASTNTSDWQPSRGQVVTLSIRPEAFLTSQTNGELLHATNRFRGRVRAATYLGATAQYYVQVSDEVMLKIAQTNPFELLRPSEEIIDFGVLTEDVVALAS